MDRATATAGLKVVAATPAWCVARGEHVYVVVLDGVTHYQFTDSDATDVRNGCSPQTPLADAQARVVEASNAFLSAALAGTGLGAEALRGVPGAVVEVK